VRYELLRILVADDNNYARVLLIEILRALGVQHIHEAADGAESLQVMRDNPVDVVFTDLTMAPLDGIDFTRLLRNSPESPNKLAPVIMVTGHSTVARIREARDAGVNEFIVKPLNARAVIERLHQAVDNPRPFVRSGDYFGPDRRRRNDPRYEGPMRRATDHPRG